MKNWGVEEGMKKEFREGGGVEKGKGKKLGKNEKGKRKENEKVHTKEIWRQK